MVPASLQGRYVIRFTVTSHYTVEADIERDWAVISETATAVLKSVSGEVSPEPRPVPGLAPVTAEDEEETAPEEEEEDTKGEKTLIQRKRDRLRRRDFGLSLLLSNKRIKSRTSLFFDLVFSDLVRSFVELWPRSLLGEQQHRVVSIL